MSAIHNDSDSASEYQESESAEPERPNRWRGLPSTWRRLTTQDRGVTTSLEQERDRDLSVHLYNAHALKQRAKILTEDPGNALKDDYPAIAVDEQIFKPPKTWTAWPLPPNEVPRIAENDDLDDKYTYKRSDAKFPSTELEDVLMGATLKFAKERFEGREFTSAGGDSKIEGEVELVEGEDEILSVDGIEPIKEEKPQRAPPRPDLEPVVSADDERSRVLLGPSVRHTLSMLDEILIALHHARKTCRRYSMSEADTDDDTLSMTGSASSTLRRLQGRPRKFPELPDRSIISRIEHQDPNDSALFRSKKTHRGRPQKAYPHLPGETQQDYLVRIARIQKKSLPSFAPPREVKEKEPNSPPERSGWSPEKRATCDEQHAREKRIVGLRDWSEVIGSAALVGVSEDAIARATQRCANLFGEGMVMRSIMEAPFRGDDAYVEKRYQPEAIPDHGEDSSESFLDEGGPSDDSEPSRDAKGTRRKSGAKVNNVFCPIPDCPRKRQGFRHNTALKKHLQNSHEVPKQQLDEYVIPSDDEIDGAVHVDGFLRSIKDFRKPKRKIKVEVKEEYVSEEEDRLPDLQPSMDSDEERVEHSAETESAQTSPAARSAAFEEVEGA